MNPIKIVIVEDEEPILEIVRLYLEKEGFEVHGSLTAIEGLRMIEIVEPDAVLLDVNLPDQSGFEIARKFREQSEGVLIFITGEKAKDRIMHGFEVGCDDYVVKPFDPAELVARVKANVRRILKKNEDIYQIGDLTINFKDVSVLKKGKTVELSTKERMLLFYLIQHPNQVISTEQLFDAVWGIDADSDLKTVSVHMSTLRKKIEDNPSKPQHIVTVRGFGYKFSN